MTSKAKIFEMATLIRKVDRSSNQDTHQLDKALAGIGAEDLALALFVLKLMDGKPYCISAGNSQTVSRYIEIASEIGATWTEHVSMRTPITFFPPHPFH